MQEATTPGRAIGHPIRRPLFTLPQGAAGRDWTGGHRQWPLWELRLRPKQAVGASREESVPNGVDRQEPSRRQEGEQAQGPEPGDGPQG